MPTDIMLAEQTARHSDSPVLFIIGLVFGIGIGLVLSLARKDS